MKKIILILVVAVVLVGGYFYINNSTQSNKVITEDSNENNAKKTIDTIEVGDKIGEMTVTKVGPFNVEVSNQDIDFQNSKIVLKGPIIISGTSKVISSEEGFSAYCFNNFDMASIKKLPLLSEDKPETYSFCLRSEQMAQQKIELGDGEKKVTVQIDNFEIRKYPGVLVEYVADLVKVVSVN